MAGKNEPHAGDHKNGQRQAEYGKEEAETSGRSGEHAPKVGARPETDQRGKRDSAKIKDRG